MSTAGIGDPYWYEWTVGLHSIVDMLNPENKIKSVTFQNSQIESWDDVIVRFESGGVDYYQIKHTYSNDTFSYSDLISSVGEEESLLKKLSKAWKKIPNKGNSRFIIFSNRKIGTNRSNIERSGRRFMRPSLEEFWQFLQTERMLRISLNEFQIPSEYQDSFNEEFLAALNELDNNQSITFLRQLSIEFNQKSLPELEVEVLEKLCRSFRTEISKSKVLLNALDGALRNWATTNRRKEEVIPNDVYEVLGKGHNEIVGDHQIAVRTPFFTSRGETVKSLIQSLEDPNYKIVFLTGLPGIGKTTIISQLYNTRENIIHLRYYTFKPISPENDLLPADAGKTCESRSLWNDLLIQLREYFKDSLWENFVPIRNDFIDSVEELRSEVLRLSMVLSGKIGKRVIICIDGIDHAARSGLDGRENYLNTLIPPDNFPDEIAFLISGQPAESYDKYPHWLRQSHDQIKTLEVPNILESEILKLIDSKFNENRDWIAHEIFKITKGNTLSVLYAVKTVNSHSIAKDAIDQLENSRLKDGLSNYYNSIWDHIVEKLLYKPSLPYQLAAILSLTSVSLSIEHFRYLLAEADLSTHDWQIILEDMSPLIIKEDGRFSLLHNDARVFFTQIVSRVQKEIYSDISLRLVQLYNSDENFVKQKHTEVVRLLKKSSRSEEILNILNPRFVMEAYITKTPRFVLEETIQFAFQEIINLKSMDSLHSLTCVIKTFSQLDRSLETLNREWNFIDLDHTFLNELRVENPLNWTLNSIQIVFKEIYELACNRKFDRAFQIVERWFSGLTFSKFLAHFSDDELFSRNLNSEGEKLLSSKLKQVLELIGRVEVRLEFKLFDLNYNTNEFKEFYSTINTGYISELMEISDVKEYYLSFNLFQGTFFKKDLEALFLDLFQNSDLKRIYPILKYFEPNSVGKKFKGVAYLSAILVGKNKLIKKWKMEYSEILKTLERSFANYDNNNYTIYGAIGFLSAIIETRKDNIEIRSELVSVILQGYPEEIKTRIMLNKILEISIHLGRWYKEIFQDKKKSEFIYINEDLFSRIIDDILYFLKSYGGGIGSPTEPLKLFLQIANKLSKSSQGSYSYQFKLKIETHYSNDFVFDEFFTIICDIWYQAHNFDKCSELLENLLGDSGKIWAWSLEERITAFEEIWKSRKPEFLDILNNSNHRMQWYHIGFANRKEYSIQDELLWLECILVKDPLLWKDYGVKLFEFSEKVQEIADNRAAYDVIELLLKNSLKINAKIFFDVYSIVASSANFYKSLMIEALVNYINESHISYDTDFLKQCWMFICGFTSWKVSDHRKGLYDLKHSIIRNANDSDKGSIVEFMKQTNQLEFEIDKLQKIETKISNNTESLIQNRNFRICLSESSDKFIKNPILFYEFIREWNIENTSEFRISLDEIVEVAIRIKDLSGWKYSGNSKLFKYLLPYLNNYQRLKILKSIYSNFYDMAEFKYYSSLGDTLDSYCLNLSLNNIQLLKAGFNNILSTHEEWFSGFTQSRSQQEIINNSSADDDYDDKNKWIECFLKILLIDLDSRSALKVESSLRNILQILIEYPENCSVIVECWNSFSYDQKEYLLIGFEAIISPQ
jgi:hypothetical protein